jgi:hypothetical protein
MKNIISNFMHKWNKSLKKDKQIHFKIGIVVGFSAILGYWFKSFGYIFSALLIQAFAYGIELYQSTTKTRHVESLDAYALSAGGIVSMTVVMIVIEFLFR